MDHDKILRQVQHLQKNIKHICNTQKIQHTITICAATKYANSDETRSLYQAGLRVFGENRLQEALKKQEDLKDLGDIEWHYIGHIQSNKVKKITDNFRVIQSIDSLDILRKINNYAVIIKKHVVGFVQINIGQDENKFGFKLEDVEKKQYEIFSLSNVKIKGIMIILPLTENTEQRNIWFNQARELFQNLKEKYELTELSMGMSTDYEQAINCGSTMVRVGSLLFK